MAHYAFLDENNIVVQVIVGKDETDTSFNWEEFYSQEIGLKCLRTSYNTKGNINLNGGEPYRKNYAGIGYFYDETLDAFIEPKPHNSWVLNTDTCTWSPPISMPDDGKEYIWNEELGIWDEFILPDVDPSLTEPLSPPSPQESPFTE